MVGVPSGLRPGSERNQPRARQTAELPRCGEMGFREALIDAKDHEGPAPQTHRHPPWHPSGHGDGGRGNMGNPFPGSARISLVPIAGRSTILKMSDIANGQTPTQSRVCSTVWPCVRAYWKSCHRRRPRSSSVVHRHRPPWTSPFALRMPPSRPPAPCTEQRGRAAEIDGSGSARGTDAVLPSYGVVMA